ncbi:uncharacterized protein LOC129741682 [Uranotaenia lowii]|uniref:uncharacterized protein LOC129741682 n=1 Tax=Uranotaenia lowii TaxID=190385 RepID=UPI0024798FF0|nr:uncharacterized protein LOC129741682 [Uranotaenia lowii]
MAGSFCWTKLNDGEVITEQPFKELIGFLQYLTTPSRSDICVAVSALNKYQANTVDRNWQGLKRVLRYLRGTTDSALVFGRNVYSEPLIGYTEVGLANDSNDWRSVADYAYMIFGNLSSWSTKRQWTVSLSSTDTEIGAVGAGFGSVIEVE